MQVIFNEIFVEHPSTVVFPEETNVVPGQDTSISELLDRFTRGQRLNVKCRPENPMVTDYDVFERETGQQVGIKYGEDDNIRQPIIDNIDDLDDYLEEQREQLRQYRSKSKDVKELAKEPAKDPAKDPVQEKSE